jgi:23S rRNA pseudouridine2604 synthase
MKRHIVFTDQEVRLNKYLSLAGICSRREADKLMEEKKVAVNGRHVSPGIKVVNGDALTIMQDEAACVYFLYYKPRGEIVAAKRSDKGVLLDPIGRLDKESEGLLLYTNDFRVTEKLLHPSFENEKEYTVTVREKPTPRVERLLLAGIHTQEGDYKPAKKVLLIPDSYKIVITLTEGKKHEIRRMLNALNLTISKLVRTKLLFFTMHSMKESVIREITKLEKAKLLKELGLKELSHIL